MKNKHQIILFIIALTALTACKKYLDVTPKGIVIPKNTTEFEGLLNSPTLTQTFAPELLTMTDDCLYVFDNLTTSINANAYFWREYLNVEDQASPAIWGNLYSAVYFTNVIINGVEKSAGGTEAKKLQVLGEALVLRAYCYLDLVTVFSKAYNSTTVATDPGLPLVTSIDMNDKTPPRSTLRVTLDAMISDVNKAIEYLPTTNLNRYRVTKYAAYGLLSRIYLYMADYANAKKFAELALAAPHSLLNYNSYTATTAAAGFPLPDNNPEILWQRTSVDYTIPFQVLYSGEMQNYYDSSINYSVHPDLRYRYLSVGYSIGVSRTKPNGSYTNFGITFPEMDLTVAEILARNGDAAGAMAIVNTLRKARIKTTNYVDLTASTGPAALNIVLAERRRELAFGGLRWFDMKRLDQEGRMPIVRRINPATATSPAILMDSLPPHSLKYTFQIPIRVSAFNPGMEKNAR